MKSNEPWEKLTQAARQARPEASTEAPFGFATRVVARWQAAEPVTLESVWQVLSLRSLAVAALLMVASLTVNYDLMAGEDWTQDLAMADSVFQTALEP